MRNLKVLLFIIPALLLGCSKTDTPSNPDVVSIQDLLPRDNEISNWSRQGGTGASWVATNVSELQLQINGGFELFANHGFVEAAMQRYTGKVGTESNVEIEVQVYDQGSTTQADAVFDDPNNVFTNPIPPSNPPSAKAEIRKDIFSYTIKFTKAKYYCLITIFSSNDKAQEVLEVFAGNIASRIQ